MRWGFIKPGYGVLRGLHRLLGKQLLQACEVAMEYLLALTHSPQVLDPTVNPDLMTWPPPCHVVTLTQLHWPKCSTCRGVHPGSTVRQHDAARAPVHRNADSRSHCRVRGHSCTRRMLPSRRCTGCLSEHAAAKLLEFGRQSAAHCLIAEMAVKPCLRP